MNNQNRIYKIENLNLRNEEMKRDCTCLKNSKDVLTLLIGFNLFGEKG